MTSTFVNSWLSQYVKLRNGNRGHIAEDELEPVTELRSLNSLPGGESKLFSETVVMKLNGDLCARCAEPPEVDSISPIILDARFLLSRFFPPQSLVELFVSCFICFYTPGYLALFELPYTSDRLFSSVPLPNRPPPKKTHTRTCTCSQARSRTYSLTLMLSLSRSHCHSHSLTGTLTCTHIHAHAHAHSLSVSLSSCWIAHRLDTVTLLYICFPCHRPVMHTWRSADEGHRSRYGHHSRLDDVAAANQRGDCRVLAASP